MQQKLPWSQTGGNADTTEAIERTLAIAVRYAHQPSKLAEAVTRNTILTQVDNTVVSMTVAYCAVLSLLVEGHRLDTDLSGKLMKLVKTGELPFHAVTSDNLQPPKPGVPDPPRIGRFASPDALLTPSCMAAAASDPGIKIEPAWKVSLVHGMPCAIYHQLPAAYYLAARFHNNFESALLHAINGGGQNQARAILTGALVWSPNWIFWHTTALFGWSYRFSLSPWVCRTDRGPGVKITLSVPVLPGSLSDTLHWLFLRRNL